MRKEKRNIIILICCSIAIIFISYIMVSSGFTNKLFASVNKLTATVNDSNLSSDYPVIKMVINSTGEEITNGTAAITVFAEGRYKIDKLYYSFDNINWTDKNTSIIPGNNMEGKIVFNDTKYSKLYLIVENEKGYKSYSYETVLYLDNSLPNININKEQGKYFIKLSDDYELKYIQYSNDLNNWHSEEISGKMVTLLRNDIPYKYIRVVDLAGNISKYNEVK